MQHGGYLHGVSKTHQIILVTVDIGQPDHAPALRKPS